MWQFKVIPIYGSISNACLQYRQNTKPLELEETQQLLPLNWLLNQTVYKLQKSCSSTTYPPENMWPNHCQQHIWNLELIYTIILILIEIQLKKEKFTCSVISDFHSSHTTMQSINHQHWETDWKQNRTKEICLFSTVLNFEWIY